MNRDRSGWGENETHFADRRLGFIWDATRPIRFVRKPKHHPLIIGQSASPAALHSPEK